MIDIEIKAGELIILEMWIVSLSVFFTRVFNNIKKVAEQIANIRLTKPDTSVKTIKYQ